LKAGKLTAAQAKSLRDQVKAVRKQELADFKTNGNRQLTAAQISTLNQELDQLTSSL